MKYKVIVFDWDGTLCDSASYIVSSVQESCKKMQLPLPTPEHVKQSIGLSLEKALMHAVPQLTVHNLDEMITHFRAYQSDESIARPYLFKGTEEVLQQLKNQGYHLAIATGKSRFALDRDLKRLNLKPSFSTSRCADETQSKPHPQMLNEIIEELGVVASEVLMVGDTSHDLALAQNAGVDAIGMTYGAHEIELLKQFKSQGLLADIRHLPEWLEQLKE